MLKSTPARKEYTTTGCVIVTNMSYEKGSTNYTFTLQPKHVLLSKREKEGVDMKTLQAKETKAFLTNLYLSISAVANIRLASE